MSFISSPIVRRWIDILLLAACLLIIGLMFQTPLGKVVQKWIAFSSAWLPLVGYAATLLIVASLSIALIRLGALGVRFRVITMLRYPPFWFSAIIVIIIVGISVIFRGWVDTSDLLTNGLYHLASLGFVIFLGVLLGFSYHGLEELRSSPTSLRESTTDNAYRIRHIFDNDEDKSKGLGSALNAAKLLYKRKGIVAKIGTLPIVGDVNELWLSDKKNFKDRILLTIEEAKLYSSFDHYETVKKALVRNEQKKARNLKHTELFRKAKAIPILEVVKDYLEVLDMGGTFKAKCPFHNDNKTKSLFIYPDTGTFYCFGSSCQQFGDVIQFIKLIEGITFGDALVKLNKEYNK